MVVVVVVVGEVLKMESDLYIIEAL